MKHLERSIRIKLASKEEINLMALDRTTGSGNELTSL